MLFLDFVLQSPIVKHLIHNNLCMTTHTLLDRLIHKPVTVTLTDEQIDAISPGEMVLYKDEEDKIQS
jgi:hypothetical protein